MINMMIGPPIAKIGLKISLANLIMPSINKSSRFILNLYIVYNMRTPAHSLGAFLHFKINSGHAL